MDILVNIDVPDLERALAFYRDGLGLTVGRRFGEDGVELVGASAPIYLLVKPPGTPVASTTGQRRVYERHWTPVHLDLVVEDLDSAVTRAVAAGAILEVPARTAEWGAIAMLCDPFGNGFCILSFSAQGYDAIADPPTPEPGPRVDRDRHFW